MNKNSKSRFPDLLLKSMSFLLLVGIISIVNAGGDKNYQRNTGLNKTNAEYFLFNINNLYVPIDNKGVIADVDAGNGAGGKYDGKTFFFSGGFFLSGLDSSKGGELFASGVLSASRIEDYLPGPVGSISTDSKNQMYILSANDAPFSASWQNWKNAVTLGADFYDGDKDGIYNPVDKNNNGEWDANEDRPDLLGDVTAWCVYNDNVPKAQRRFNDVPPKGIEIRQTFFGFRTKGIIGNMLFVRYRIVNRGTVSPKYDSVYFSVAADPDLGDYADDLIGCDINITSDGRPRSAGYVYNKTADAQYGANCPTFLLDFFQGPIVQGAATDTAYNTRGRYLGRDTMPGYKNLPLTAYTQYMQSHPTHGDPNTRFELRNYMLGGKGKDGRPVDPGKWSFGSVKGYDAKLAIPHYMYHGDPVADTGWINTTPIDQRMMLNTGPFTLEKDKPVDIVAGIVLGRDGAASVKSVNVAKQYDEMAQTLFDRNFKSVAPPDSIEYSVRTGDGFIDISFPTSKLSKYHVQDSILQIDRIFQGVYLTAYRTESKRETIAGIENLKEVAHYAMANGVKNIIQKRSDGGVFTARPEADATRKLDPAVFNDSTKGRVVIRITEDPFTGGPLVKGKRYYFGLTQYTLNVYGVKNLVGDFLDYNSSALDEFENAMFNIDMNEHEYAPTTKGESTVHAKGTGAGAVDYVVVDRKKLTGNEYKVEFITDKAAANHEQYWRLINVTKNDTLIKSSKEFNYNFNDFSGAPTEGFILKVKPLEYKVAPLADQKYVTTASKPWITELFADDGTGAFYAGSDVPAKGITQAAMITNLSKVTKYNRARKVEIRFSTNPAFGKAYRYLRGFAGTNPSFHLNRAYYGSLINKAADTTSTASWARGPVGKFGEGFVDVPFQAWVKDTVLGEERQLAVAFIEKSKYFSKTSGPLVNKGLGNADGIWDPGKDIFGTGEVIIVFDENFDATGKQSVYTGLFKDKTGADVQYTSDIFAGYTIDQTKVDVTDSVKAIAASPWYNAMYIVALQALSNDRWKDGDKFVIPLNAYPYSEKDAFTFKTKVGGALTNNEQKELWNKVNVFPNPLFAYNPYTSLDPNANADDPFVTFSNLPPSDITIKIFTLSGQQIRTLHRGDSQRFSLTSPFLEWDLKNEDGLRVASGLYIAIVNSPEFGDKVLKFSIILPQKQLPRY